jgi:SAM-dependent methyltransferase
VTAPTGSGPTFDAIGAGYSDVRRTDPRLAAAIATALGHGRIVNVGAGGGSYEPVDRTVVAIEPSLVMLAQHAGTCRVLGRAEVLPFPDGSFDASMATLTVHHWDDLGGGLREMRRVADRQVVFTWDPESGAPFWLHDEYLPEMGAFERTRFPPLHAVLEHLDAPTVVPFLIPHDFADGFQQAFWRRPETFLDPNVRAKSSMFALSDPAAAEPGISALRRDLASGAWSERHAELMRADAMDFGFRIVVGGARA